MITVLEATLSFTDEAADACLEEASESFLEEVIIVVDGLLVFTGDKNSPQTSSPVQLSCHKAILCARSPFFRNLVSRRLVAQAAERQDRGPSLPQPLKIVLDETVIPQKYARVLVRALYVDTIDFDLVDEKNVEISDR